ncbi:hypothetical protein GCM10027200_27150 [Lentzea nigeriaca]
MALVMAIARFTTRARTTVSVLSPEPDGFSLMEISLGLPGAYCIRVTIAMRGNIHESSGVLRLGSAPGGR